MRYLLTLASCLLLTLPLTAAGLTAGAATSDITPPVGCPMAGYYSARGAEGTHDPLLAKALVLEKDGTKAALVVLDLISTTTGLVQETRELVEKETGIPGKHVMISATHSHTGPELADRRARIDVFGGKSDITVDYRKGLPARIAEAVKKADGARKPARVSFATGKEEGLAFNRRFHMIDGSIGWNAGKMNPRIVRPAGPVDPGVPVAYFETAEAKPAPIATYVNFAMHLDTVGGMYYSADYPYTLSRLLAAVKGDGMVTLFATGTCGDINHVNVKSATPQKGHGEAARIGTRLAAEVLRTYETMQPAADGPLRVSSEIVELPLAPVTGEDVANAKQIIADVQGGKKPKFLDQVQAFKAVDVASRLGKPYALEVQVISLGDDLAWVSLPGEIFVQLGLSIKAASPFRQTMIAELANGSIGYIPTRVAYSQGNYEVVSARCAEGSGEKLVDSAVKQLREQFKK